MSEWDPYKPPSADLTAPAPVVAAAGAEFIPPRAGRALAATIGLGLCVLLALVSLWVEWGHIGALQGMGRSDVDDAAYVTSALWMQALGILGWALYLGTGACFLAWMADACRTARSIDPAAIRDTPTWAVGWWFVPIANVYKPYAILRSIWRVTIAARAHDAGPPGVFPLWWACFLVRLPLSRLAQAIFKSADSGDLITATQVQMVSEVASIVAALAAIGVIRSIAEPQRRIARAAATS